MHHRLGHFTHTCQRVPLLPGLGQRQGNADAGRAPAGRPGGGFRRVYSELYKALELDENSRVLLFSTEGDTDPDQYRRIVWDGAYAE